MNRKFLIHFMFFISTMLFLLATCKSKQIPHITENQNWVYIDRYGRAIDTISIKLLKSESKALTQHWHKYPSKTSPANGFSQGMDIRRINLQKHRVESLDIKISTQGRKPQRVDLELLHSLKHLKKLRIAAPTLNTDDLVNLHYLDTLSLAYIQMPCLVFPKKLHKLQYVSCVFCYIEEVSFTKNTDWELRYFNNIRVKKFTSDTLKKLHDLTIGAVDTLNLDLFPNLEVCRTSCKNLKADTLKTLFHLSVGEVKEINLDLFPNLKEFSARATFLDTTHLKQKYPNIEMRFYNKTVHPKIGTIYE